MMSIKYKYTYSFLPLCTLFMKILVRVVPTCRDHMRQKYQSYGELLPLKYAQIHLYFCFLYILLPLNRVIVYIYNSMTKSCSCICMTNQSWDDLGYYHVSLHLLSFEYCWDMIIVMILWVLDIFLYFILSFDYLSLSLMLSTMRGGGGVVSITIIRILSCDNMSFRLTTSFLNFLS